jgi:hypothetical protein
MEYPAMMPPRITDAQLLQALRSLEAKGLIGSAIDIEGNLRFCASERRPRPRMPTRENVTSLGNAALNRLREEGS